VKKAVMNILQVKAMGNGKIEVYYMIVPKGEWFIESLVQLFEELFDPLEDGILLRLQANKKKRIH
jgi:hypothetical protein